jgi:hydrogenase maturation factor HypF (carbamoyltransferase family)
MHEGPARLRLREWRDSMPVAVMVKDTYVIRKFPRVAIGLPAAMNKFFAQSRAPVPVHHPVTRAKPAPP